MSVRTLSELGEYYHVYNRGVEKRVIFNSQHDYQRFLLLLMLANDTTSVDIARSIRDLSIPKLIAMARTPIVSIQAFSLLPNHFHLLIAPQIEHGVSKFMQKVATGYTMYFNRKNDRSGSLFQGKYKIKHLAQDNYLKYSFEYIHLNPIREEFDRIKSGQVAQLINKAEEYPWSSLSVYSGKVTGRLEEAVLDQTLFKELFNSYDNHRKTLAAWKSEPFEEGRTFFMSSSDGN